MDIWRLACSMIIPVLCFYLFFCFVFLLYYGSRYCIGTCAKKRQGCIRKIRIMKQICGGIWKGSYWVRWALSAYPETKKKIKVMPAETGAGGGSGAKFWTAAVKTLPLRSEQQEFMLQKRDRKDQEVELIEWTVGPGFEITGQPKTDEKYEEQVLLSYDHRAPSCELREQKMKRPIIFILFLADLYIDQIGKLDARNFSWIWSRCRKAEEHLNLDQFIFWHEACMFWWKTGSLLCKKRIRHYRAAQRVCSLYWLAGL